MKCVYKLEENGNLTFIRRIDEKDLTDPIEAVADYLRKGRVDFDQIKIMSESRIMKAAGMKFYVIKL